MSRASTSKTTVAASKNGKPGRSFKDIFIERALAAVAAAGPILPADQRGDANEGLLPCQQEVEDVREAADKLAVCVCVADVRSQPIEWLWERRIPRGTVTLGDGDPGNGKSTAVGADIAARVSQGWAMPPEPGGKRVTDPAGVLLLNAEDDLARTIRPRLEAAGADLNRIHMLTGIRTGAEGDERPPVLPNDLPLLEELIIRHGVALVVIDPFSAYLSSDIDAHKDADVRRCLHRMKLLAEKTRAAIFIIRHLNKLIGGPALYRGGGSIGIAGAVRSAMVFGRDPKDSERYVLASVKCNLARKPKSLAYAYEPVGDVARIAWIGETDLGADDILGHGSSNERQTAITQCVEAIRELLKPGPKLSKELTAELESMGYSERTVERSKRALGVKGRPAGFGVGWQVYLPEPTDEIPP